MVTSSRGVIYAYQDEAIREKIGSDWRKCVRRGAEDLAEAIRGITIG